MSLQNPDESRTGASPVVILVAIVVVVTMVMIARGAVGGRDDADAPAVADPVAGNPILEAREQAARSDSVMRATIAKTAEEEVGYGTITPPGPVDRNLRFRLESLLAGAENLINRGRAEAMRIPEADVDAGLRTARARANTAQWENWSRSWQQRVDGFARELSSTGTIEFGNPAYIVLQELTFLANDLRGIPMSYATTTNIPLKSERTAKFNAAATRVAGAKERLHKLK